MKSKAIQDATTAIGFNPLKIIGGCVLRSGRYSDIAITIPHISRFFVNTVVDYERGLYCLTLFAYSLDGAKLDVYEESFLVEDVEEIGAYSEALLTNAIYQVYAKR
jgi:hypothetical protein